MPKREIGPRNIEVTRFTPFRRIMHGGRAALETDIRRETGPKARNRL